MSILARLNPLRVVRAVDIVPHLQNLGEELRDDQKTLWRQLRTIARQLEHLEDTLKRQEKVLAGIPELQTEVRRCVAAYTSDARQAHRLPAVRARLGDGEQIAAHTEAAVAKAPLELDPFPHIIIDELLPDDVCSELIRALPPKPFFQTENATRQKLDIPCLFAPEYSRIVWGLIYKKVIARAMVTALTEKFRPALDRFIQVQWPALGVSDRAGVSAHFYRGRILRDAVISAASRARGDAQRAAVGRPVGLRVGHRGSRAPQHGARVSQFNGCSRCVYSVRRTGRHRALFVPGAFRCR